MRRVQIEAAVRADRRLARKVQTYRPQEDGLRQWSAAIREEPVPQHLLETVRRPRRQARHRGSWARALWPVAASLLIGIALGSSLRTTLQPDQDSLLEPFIRQAVGSHELFLTSEDADRLRVSDAATALKEVRNPFQMPIRIPQLLGARYRPVQFRAVEGGGGPALELAYLSDQASPPC